MTRLGVGLNAAVAILVIATLGAATAVECGADWRKYQKRYAELVRGQGAGASADESIRPHEVEATETGAVDRCTSCHLAMEPGATAFDEGSFRAHPGDLLRTHPIARFGCTSCHGGQGRALDKWEAHDRRPGGGWSAFTPAAVRCSRCHAAGIEDSDVLERGVGVYLAEACGGCHQPGRNGPGFGPDLRSIGLRGTDYIREVVLYPDRVYPQTVMPPTRFRIGEEGDSVDSLVAYLQSLEPWPRGRPRVERRFDPRTCVGCHTVDRADAVPGGLGHRCSYLVKEPHWLDCKACHGSRKVADQVPRPPARPPAADPAGLAIRQLERDAAPVKVGDPKGACPYLEHAFSVCGVCHREGEVQP